MTRITQRMLTDQASANLSRSLARTARLQEQLSTGKLLNRPSDSPTALVNALQHRADVARSTQLERNASDARGWLDTADTALQQAVTLLQRARDLTLQGQNGSLGPGAREAVGRELQMVRTGLLSVANSRYAGRGLFAGTSDAAAAFDATGTYQGDAGQVQRTLAPGQPVTVNVLGTEAFGDGADSAFAVLDRIVDDLANNPLGTVPENLVDLDAALQRVLASLGEVGARTNRVEAMRDRAESSRLDAELRLSEVESIDLPTTVMDLQLQEIAYQSALSATARVIQPSLLDFLR